MSHTKRNTPPVRDDGFGGRGAVSNTAFPTVNEAGPAGSKGFGSDLERTTSEAEQAQADVDREQGIER
jgi:hypothetical protein